MVFILEFPHAEYFKTKLMDAWHQSRRKAFAAADAVPFRAQEHGGMHTPHTKGNTVLAWQQQDFPRIQRAVPQLLEKAATIAGGISSSSTAYHYFRSGLHLQIEETELRQLAQDLQLLLFDSINAEG
jgi:hypothetical protein